MLAWAVFVPKSFNWVEPLEYRVEQGASHWSIANDLEEKGVIKSGLIFSAWSIASGNYAKLQAGTYELSPSMSVVSIVRHLSRGEIATRKLKILEGWTAQTIANYLEVNSYSKDDFLAAVYVFNKPLPESAADKPKESSLEGYLFPDTYYIPIDATGKDVAQLMLKNFDKKLTPELREEILRQNKKVFEIVTMASILEKEVRLVEDKKIVAGILWKRLEAGMPLQVDATINYITGKSLARAAIKDTKIDSPYNTYQYQGLPKGPIANPGIKSITAAIYPTESSYWYYLSADGSGKTIFSKTFAEHSLAIATYLR